MSKVYKVIQYLINSICYLRLKNPLPISAWVQVKYGKVIPRNWGDELNIYLLELLTGRKVLVTNASLWHIIFPSKKYICIGSILGWYETEFSEIWGAGAMTKNVILKNSLTPVHLVRGKYTRQLLIQQGCPCPECYGDPALLISKLYAPKSSKKYKMGIIPHYVEENQPYLRKYVAEHDDVCIISMSNYTHWTDVIDKINSCKYILSSSLHGLIVSDSYGIPNFWVNFSDEMLVAGDFKFRDYFSSVQRDESVSPIRVRDENDLIQLYHLKYEDICETAKINFDSIFESCPFIK